jgi:hypothetical protein
MGTTSSTPSAASITAPIYFTGVSSFSSDFQSIIQRAVQIADIPVQNLQNQQATNTAEENALNALDPTVTALGADAGAVGVQFGFQHRDGGEHRGHGARHLHGFRYHDLGFSRV